jgi:dihydropteroate synthase
MNRTSAWPAGPRTALMVVADTAAAAGRAVDEGADLIDLTGAVSAEVAAFRQAHPGVPVCADADGDGSPADLTRDPAVAAASGARLICARQEEAALSGLPPERLLIETTPAGLMAALAGGYPVLVDLPGTGARPGETAPGDGTAPDEAAIPGDGPPGAAELAVAALSGWLGAAVVRTRHPQPVRRALDLTDSVRGVRPPARTVRGLA